MLGIEARLRLVEPVQYRARVEDFDFDITVQRMVFDTVEECERVKTYGVEGNRQTNARLKAYLETLR